VPSIKAGVKRPALKPAAPKARQITFASEIIRKIIHLVSLSIPIMYFYVSRSTALYILFPVTLLLFVVDMGRHYVAAIRHVVARLFDPILRPHERKSGLLSGATYVFISALICVLVIPKMITITAFSILIVSDASSALFGRAFGRHRFLDKSLEGSLAFVVTAWIVVLITPKALAGWPPSGIEYSIGAFAAVIGGIAEAASARSHLDDNLSIPLSVGFTMWGLYYLLGQLDPARFGSLYAAMLHF
jgi:dolichol kinase